MDFCSSGGGSPPKVGLGRDGESPPSEVVVAGLEKVGAALVLSWRMTEGDVSETGIQMGSGLTNRKLCSLSGPLALAHGPHQVWWSGPRGPWCLLRLEPTTGGLAGLGVYGLG